MMQHQNEDKRVWAGMLAKIGIACVAGILLSLLMVPLLPEADVHHEAAAEEEITEVDDEQEESPPAEEVHITQVEAVEIPEIAVAQEIPDVANETVAEIAEAEASQAPAPEHIPEPPPLPVEQPVAAAAEPAAKEQAETTSVEAARASERIDLSSEELAAFIRTQTVDNKAKAFPRIHITYENVDMETQLSFYRSRGYGFFAVEMENGVIADLLGRIDMDTRKLFPIDGGNGLAWNYGSVIMRYRRIATQASSNANAYLAVVPTYDVANLILSSIDKALDGEINGDYRNHKSYRAIFTTRGQNAILTVLIPNGSSFTKREIRLSRNT
jgi:hypothetical protein